MTADIDLRQLGNTLHQRLLDGDPVAPAQIAEEFLPSIIKNLERKYPMLDDPHEIDTAAEDALLSYFDRPQQYDPSKSSLGTYLRMSANGDLLNSLNKHKPETYQERLAEVVELDDIDSEYGVEIEDELDVEEEVFARLSPVWQRVKELIKDPIDQEIIFMMMDNIRETAAFADVLGIFDLPPKEQFAIVQQHKDRLKKKLRRSIDRSEFDRHD